MKLRLEHFNEIKKIFQEPKFMRCVPDSPLVDPFTEKTFINTEHEIFCNNYLGQLKNWHSFVNNDFTCAVVFYQGEDEASWYVTDIYGTKDFEKIFQEIVDFNEKSNLYKFYILIPLELIDTFSINLERYDYFDEMIIKEKTKCFYTLIWQILFKRISPNKTSVVRCYFLKQSHRKHLPIAGNI